MVSDKIMKYRLAYEKCVRRMILENKPTHACETKFDKLDFKIPKKVIRKSIKRSKKRKSPKKSH